MLRAYLFLMVFIPLTVAFAAVAWISTLVEGTGRAYHRIACAWSRVSLAMAGANVVASGQDNIPDGVPVIFMSNHQSSFDIPALYQAIPVKFSWIAKEELFSYPVFGHSMRRAGYIPLDRGNGRKALNSMIAAAERIRQGCSVVIFPEGTRSEDGNLIPFKKGGFLLAERANVPVVPVSISGSGAITPANRIWIKPGTIRIRFGQPITAAVQAGAGKRTNLMDQVRTAIAVNLEA